MKIPRKEYIDSEKNLLYAETEIQQTIERCAKEWILHKKRVYFLLKGEFLIVAENYYLSSGENLSFDAIEFILASIKLRNLLNNSWKKKKRNQLVIFPFIGAIITFILIGLSPESSNIFEEEIGLINRVNKPVRS